MRIPPIIEGVDPVNVNRRRLAVLLALATVMLAGVSAPATAGPPTRKIALGVSMQPYTSMANLDAFIADTGRNPAIYSVWSAWGGASSKAFPTALLDSIRTRSDAGSKIVPMIFWEPANPSNLSSQAYTYRKIIRGDFDAYITEWATAAKAYGGRILLRFAAEMNGYWWPWGTQSFDNTPKRFRLAWQHVWNIFKGPGGVGATNVKFLWSPNKPCGRCDSLASVWPGKTYVDYAGFSAFNWSGVHKWMSMVNLYKSSMDALKAITTKPVIVAETATADFGGNKVNWITNGYKAVYTAYPRIRGIVYFNVDTSSSTDNRNWRLDHPDLAPLQAYAALLTDARFQGVIP